MAAILRINKLNLRLKCGECALNLRIRDCFVFVLALDDRQTKITSYPSLIRLLSENVYGIILRLKMIVPIWGIWGLIPAIEQTWDVAHLSARNFGEGRMATRSWNEDRAKKRIDAQIDALPLKDIEIKDYVRDTDLTKDRRQNYRIGYWRGPCGKLTLRDGIPRILLGHYARWHDRQAGDSAKVGSGRLEAG